MNEKWLLLNVKDEILGRMASKVARILMGKNKTNYLPNKVKGDNVIIINSSKIKVTGKKLKQKLYYRHSGYPGGLKSIYLKDMLKKNSNYVIKHAIKGMLPKNKTQKVLLKKLRIYSNAIHPHLSQKPQVIEIGKI